MPQGKDDQDFFFFFWDGDRLKEMFSVFSPYVLFRFETSDVGYIYILAKHVERAEELFHKEYPKSSILHQVVLTNHPMMQGQL